MHALTSRCRLIPHGGPLRIAAALLLMTALLGISPAAAQSDADAFLVYAKSSRLDMVELSSRMIELPDATKTVDQFDPAVLSIEGISDRQVRITAIGPGVTTVGFTSADGIVRTLEVFVKGDTRHLQAYLRELFPGSNVRAVQVGETGDAVVIRGWVTDPTHIAEIMDIAGEFYANPINQMRTATAERVLLECRVVEVNRTKLREFGFDFFNFGSTVRFGSQPGQLTPQSLSNQIGGLGLQEAILAAPTLAIQIARPGYAFNGFLQALQTDSVAKILAEPHLTVTSGRPANLLSGGEFPILVPQGIGNSTIEFREFGVRVEAVAVVLGNNRLRLDISPEVSERDFSSAITLQGVQVPGLTTRRVNTSAELGFGETLMLGGLVSTRDVGSTSKVPFLGELPYIGMAFSKKRYQQSETELLIMVTPHPAGTLNPELLPAGPGLNTTFPTDKELYVDGLLELPNYGEPCSDTNPNCGPGYLMPPMGGGCPDGQCGSGFGYDAAIEPYPAAMAPAIQPAPVQPSPSYPTQSYPVESYPTESYPAESYNPGVEMQPMPSSVPAQMEFDSPGTYDAHPMPQPVIQQPIGEPVTSTRRGLIFRRGDTGVARTNPQPSGAAQTGIVQTSATAPAAELPQVQPAASPAKPKRRNPLRFLRSEY